jgi:hypothetical protein
MKAYVSKYALSQGITEVEAETSERFPDMITWKKNGYTCYVHKGDWHLTKAEAIQHAEILREKKIKSLQKQILKLETLQF